MKAFLYKFLLPILCLVFGVLLGIVIRDFPKFKLVYELKITDVFQNIITLGVGVFVPILVKKIIDDSRSVKNTLLKEVEIYEEQVKSIYQLFKQSYTNNKISQTNKENLNFSLEQAETKLDSLKFCLNEQMPKSLDKELAELSNSQNCIWKKLTGQSLSPKSITKIDQTLYNEVTKLDADLHNTLTKLKTKIHKH